MGFCYGKKSNFFKNKKGFFFFWLNVVICRVRRTKNYLISGGLDILFEGIFMFIEYDSFFKGSLYGILR